MEPPESTASAAAKIILRWDSTTSKVTRDKLIFTGDGRLEIETYLGAVDELLQKSLSSTTLSDLFSSTRTHTLSALQIAMARLEDEFRNILMSHASPIETESLTESTHSDHTSQEFDSKQETAGDSSGKQLEHQESATTSRYKSTNSIREVDLIPGEAVNDLRRIAERMIAAGYLPECVQVYASVRKSAVDASLNKLNVEKLSIGDVQRLDRKTLETEIGRWILAAKVCVRVLFASERRLCRQIFEGLGDCGADDACFMETIKGPAMQLFNFAEAVSISERSPEKLFKILDLRDALVELLPDVETIFDLESGDSIRVQAGEILSRLAEAAIGIFSEFENKVRSHESSEPVPGGTIHPLTRYVMNYIGFISEYKRTLIQLIDSGPSTEMDFSVYEGHDGSTLALHLIWVIDILESNLDGKSKHYKDASLANVFMINNVHYIVEQVKGSPELRQMIGDAYLKRLKGKFTSSALISYQRAALKSLLHCLRDEGLHASGGVLSGASIRALRERFNAFNATFDEVYKTQATWLIPDDQLREDLRIAITQNLIPAYRSFLERFKRHIERGRHPENYIRYSVEGLQDKVLDFFKGSAVP